MKHCSFGVCIEQKRAKTETEKNKRREIRRGVAKERSLLSHRTCVSASQIKKKITNESTESLVE
jgi:hypothetical protein